MCEVLIAFRLADWHRVPLLSTWLYRYYDSSTGRIIPCKIYTILEAQACRA